MDAVGAIIYLGIVIAVAVGMYKTFSKLGYDDAWWLFIPILNFVFMLKFIDKPIWWIVLLFIPLVNLIVGIYVAFSVADKVSKSYGKGIGYTLGLIFLSFIFYPILGFTAEPIGASGNKEVGTNAMTH